MSEVIPQYKKKIQFLKTQLNNIDACPEKLEQIKMI